MRSGLSLPPPDVSRVFDLYFKHPGPRAPPHWSHERPKPGFPVCRESDQGAGSRAGREGCCPRPSPRPPLFISPPSLRKCWGAAHAVSAALAPGPLEPTRVLQKALVSPLARGQPCRPGPGGVGEGRRVRLWESRGKRQRPDSLAQLPRNEPKCLVWAEGNLPRFLGMLGLAGNQSPGWQTEVDSGPRIQRGSRRRGPRGGEGEVSVNHIN